MNHLLEPPSSHLPPDLQSRLVPLGDGRPGLRGVLPAEIREPASPDALPIIDFVASDETLDRYEEILTADGWRLEHYRRNPVFQNAHQYGDILFTLGKALQTEVRNGQLLLRVQFATDVNPMARVAYGLYRGRFLNAVSVGFIPLRWENGDAGARPPGATVCRRKYLEQELLEVSAVSIPANPNALQLGLRAGCLRRDDLTDLLDLLRQTLASGDPPQHQPGPKGAPDFSELLSLARQVSRLIRRD